MSVSCSSYQCFLFSRGPVTESAGALRGTMRDAGDSLMVTCNASGFNFRLFWVNCYHQAPERPHEFVSKISPSGNVKDYTFSMEGRFATTRNNINNHLYLQTNRLKPEAEYYCSFTAMNHRETEGGWNLPGRQNERRRICMLRSVIFLQLDLPLPDLYLHLDHTWDYLLFSSETVSSLCSFEFSLPVYCIQGRLGQRVRRDVMGTLRNQSWVTLPEVLLARGIVLNDDWVVRKLNSYLPLRWSWPPIMVTFVSPWLLGHWRKETERAKHVIMPKWKRDENGIFSEFQISPFCNPSHVFRSMKTSLLC